MQKLKDIQELLKDTQKSAEAIRRWLNYEMDDPIKTIYQIRQEINENFIRAVKDSSNCPSGDRQIFPVEEVTMIVNQNRDTIEYIKSLCLEVQHLKNSLENQKTDVKCITQAIESLKNPRLDSIVSDTCDMKNIVQELQAQIQNTSRQEISTDKFTVAIEPISQKIGILTDEIKELKEHGASQWAFQNNSGLGTELAVAEIREKLDNLQVCNCSPLKEDNDHNKYNHATKEQQIVGPTRSYAEALIKPRFALLIESSDPRHTSEDVVSTIKDNIDVVQLGVGVNNVRRVRNQKVVITCNTEEDRSKLQSAIKNSAKKLTVSKSSTKNPLIKLLGISNDLNNKKLEEALVKQNVKLFKDIEKDDIKIKVLRRIKGRTAAVSNIVIEVSPWVWKALKDQKVHVGYQIVPAIDQSPIVQCYRCMGFGHRANECAADKSTCGYCAGEHDSRQCPRNNGAPSCANCIKNKVKGDHSHAAYSAECLVWQKWDRIARSLVAYC
ncbi:unnamed protein product [Parnassius mnemosyne]